MKKTNRIKVFGVAFGPLALLCAGCGTIVATQMEGCFAVTPSSSSCTGQSALTSIGSMCYYQYQQLTFISGTTKTTCQTDSQVISSTGNCGDVGAVLYVQSSSDRLRPRAASTTLYPANQMQTFLSTPSGSSPFDLKQMILDLPFQPLFPAPGPSQAGQDNCDSTVTVLVAGYSTGTVTPVVPCNVSVGSPIQTGQGSLEIALTPDGKFAFVTNYNGSVTVVDTKALSVIATIPTPGANPFGIAISADGTTAYVASFNPASPALLVLNVATRTLTSTVPLTVVPQNLFLSPDGSLLWITSQTANNVTILDALTLMPAASITSIPAPTGIGFNATGTIAYVASATSPGTVQAVNTQTYAVTTSYTVGNVPVDVRVSSPAYVTVMNRSSDFISQINVLTGQVTSQPVTPVPNGTHTGLAFIQ